MLRLALVMATVLAVGFAVFFGSQASLGLSRARQAETRAREIADAIRRDREAFRLSERRALLEQIEIAWSELEAAERESDAASDRRSAELLESFEQKRVLAAQLDLATTRIEQLQEDLRRQVSERNQPMPVGLRRLVANLQEYLSAAGRSDLRLLRAERLEDRSLFGVEILLRSTDGLGVKTYFADRATFCVDRARSELTIALSDGEVLGDETSSFGADGPRLLVADVDAAAWEAGFPLLVTAQGVAPSPEPVETPLGSRSLSDWRARLERLLGAAVGTESWHVSRLHDLRAGGFERLVLVGKDGTRVLTRSLEAESAVVEIDRENETVCLLVRNGFLRRQGGTTTIPASGMRIPLPGVTPGSAEAEMLGYVEYR